MVHSHILKQHFCSLKLAKAPKSFSFFIKYCISLFRSYRIKTKSSATVPNVYIPFLIFKRNIFPPCLISLVKTSKIKVKKGDIQFIFSSSPLLMRLSQPVLLLQLCYNCIKNLSPLCTLYYWPLLHLYMHRSLLRELETCKKDKKLLST